MKSIGARPPVDKFIQAINKKMDSDLIYKYIKEIASYYTSEYKTKEDILNTLERDIQILMFYYRLCYLVSGHDEEYNKQMSQYKIEFTPNKAAEIPMKNISWGVIFLIREAAIYKVYLDPDKLERLGLKGVPDPIDSIKTLYDKAIQQYKIQGCTKQVPEWTDKVRQCFQSRKLYEDFYSMSIGCSPNEIADNYFNLPMDKKFLWDFNKPKALYDYFINPSKESPSYNDYKPSGAPIQVRQFRNILNDARDRVLGKQA